MVTHTAVAKVNDIELQTESFKPFFAGFASWRESFFFFCFVVLFFTQRREVLTATPYEMALATNFFTTCDFCASLRLIVFCHKKAQNAQKILVAATLK
jgi:hypothetical protein